MDECVSTLEAAEFLPPTSALPSIKELQSTSVARLQRAMDYLYLIYLPEVRGSQRRRQDRTEGNRRRAGLDPSPPSTHASASTIQSIRSDPFERAFALRWLTALSKVLSEYYGQPFGDDVQGSSDSRADVDEERQNLIDRAASLLASCSGASATGTISRHFKFSPLDCQTHAPVFVVLTDVPLVNDDFGTVGAQTWGGACVLSEMLIEDPSSFGLAPSTRPHPQRTLRILELGSGTGLVGLTISKLFMQISTSSFASSDPGSGLTLSSVTKVEIVLTDFHPVVLENLRRNFEANIGPLNGQTGESRFEVDVRVRQLDWEAVYRAGKGGSSGVNELEGQDAADMDMEGGFDLIFGADIMYEEHHVVWVRACLEKMLARSNSAACHLVIPLRSTHAKESSTIDRTFPRTNFTASDADNPDEQKTPVKPCQKLAIFLEEKIVCDALPDSSVGRAAFDGAEEVVYEYYKIGWEDLA